MNYELAKKLKDSGFPHKCAMLGGEDGNDEYCFHRDWFEEEGFLCVPTLSELIDACGEKFYRLQIGPSLMGDRNVWYAYMDEETGMIGDTPEEAVANLWLKLNKK